MSRSIVNVIVLVLASAAAAQRAAPPVLPGPIGALHHPIQTRAAEAQRLFNQGLTLYYGFNREGARRSFAAAVDLDPTAAMPHVGIALSFGPNLNTESTAAEVRRGCDAARRGAGLAQKADEKAYADALVVRYCNGLSFDSSTEYAIEMGTLFQQRSDDPDAATLYADSLMALRPRTSEQNVELVGVLELVLRRWPDHVGANHYYVHAVEGSSSPERGLASAQRLETLVPAVGHLLHMPSHVYTRLGDHNRAIDANVRAAAADLAYLKSNPGDTEQVTSYEHDVDSLVLALSTAGRLARARQAADTAPGTHGHGGSTPGASTFSPARLFVLLRFFQWSDVVRSGAPPPGDRSLAWYYFARALAYAQLKQWSLADADRQIFEREAKTTPDNAIYRSNRLRAVHGVYQAVLEARFADARGNRDAALESWRRAVAAQDQLAYHEPAPIYYPIRESLGGALFRSRQYQDAVRVFEEDLARNPGNGRSLFGLWKTLAALDRPRDAEAVRRRFVDAWATSDVELSMDGY